MIRFLAALAIVSCMAAFATSQVYNGYYAAGYGAHPWSPQPPTMPFGYGPMVPADLYPPRLAVVYPVIVSPWGGGYRGWGGGYYGRGGYGRGW